MRVVLLRLGSDLIGRIGGPLTFRLVMQPLTAGIIAFRPGWKHGCGGRALYFWSLLTQPDERRRLVQDGWRDIARIFIFSILIDLIYQLIVLHWFCPFEAAAVALFVAVLPYLAIRGSAKSISAVQAPPYDQASVRAKIKMGRDSL